MGMPAHRFAIQIASAGTDSPVVTFDKGVSRADQLHFYTPTTLPETITIEVSIDAGVTFQTVQSGGADIALAARKFVVADVLPTWDQLRIHSGVGVAANRDFVMVTVNRFNA